MAPPGNQAANRENKLQPKYPKKPAYSTQFLILADGVAGWGKEGDWGDIRFMLEYDLYMEKIAVVADNKWRDPFLMYLAAGHRKGAVEYFPSGEESKARTWLA